MEDDVLDYENRPAGLPVFLKVLCILTFVGAGLYTLVYLFNMINFENSIKQLEMSQKILSKDSPFGDMGGLVEATKEWGMLSYGLGLAGCLLCLAGALMMWKLKKIGFYIYVLGQIIPFIGSFLLMSAAGNQSSAFMGAVSTVSVVIAIIFSLAFIVMYAFNLKHLK
jgi:hypothetical protein